jgi:release factor glutamine methyltransferase
MYTIEKKPLEYILGWVEFLRYRFVVWPATLIPRPETEYMIEAINEYIAEHSQQQTIFDIWTWCGVLWLSVCLHNTSYITQAYLTDLSSDALSIAKQNYATYTPEIQDIPVTFLEASLLDDLTLRAWLEQAWSVSILVANLPYIPEQTFEDNTDIMVKKREPKIAFVWGDDGLDLYRIMFDQLLQLDSSPTMFLEMMTRQVDILRQEYPEKISFEEVKTFHFNIRIVRANRI